MSDDELRAKMTSPGGWGQVGNAVDGPRYMKPVSDLTPRRRRKCYCGCGQRETHVGFANGVALTGGCEWMVRRWVRDPKAVWRSLAERPAAEPLVCDCGQEVRTVRGLAAHKRTSYRHAVWVGPEAVREWMSR